MSACPLRLTPQRALSPAEVMFGGIWIGPGSGEHGDGQRPDLGRENALATVRAAVEAGIREFDTAPWYGAGASEERLGQALNALPDELRADLLVITKAGRLFRDEDGMPCGPGFDAPDRRPLWSRVCVNDYTAEGARISLQESLERLNLTSGGPRVGLRIHDPNDNSNSRAGAHGGWADEVGVALRGDGMCSGLRELRAAGSICHVSLGMNCNREPHQGAPEGVLRLLRGCPAGTFDSALLAGGWNLLCTEGITCMEECQRMGLPVHVAGVFGSGLLAESFSPSSSSPSSATYAYRPAQPDVAERARRWRELAAAHGHPLPAVAIAFAALPACVSRLVLGFSTPQQVDEGMAWVRQARRVGVAVWHDAKRLGLLSDGLPVPTVGPAEA